MSALERLAGSFTEGATFKKRNVDLILKHGSHNQKTHGGKGGGGSGGESFNTLDAFETFVRDPENKYPSYEELLELSASQKPEYGQSAVYGYVNDSSQVNRALRIDPEDAEQIYGNVISELDETMVRTPNITNAITVYRGVRGGDDMPPEFEELEVGDVFSDSAFVSTSLSPTSALGFAGVYSTQGSTGAPSTQGIVFEISVPANSEGIFPNSWLGTGGMGSSNNFASELEFLLPRDSQFKVLSTEGVVWKLEVTGGQK
jgi:hypothetical protein